MEAGATTTGVTRRVTEKIRLPGRAARSGDDIRSQVTLGLPEFAPWLLRFDFIRYGDDVDPEWESFELAGFAFEYPTTLAEAEAALAADKSLCVGAEMAGRFFRYFWSYKRIAELRLRFDDSAWRHRDQVLEIEPGTRAYRNLELLVEMYRAAAGLKGRGRMYYLEEALRCTRKTVWEYLRKAREAGLIDADELDLRAPTE